MNYNEMIEVIQAAKEGKTIQVRALYPETSKWRVMECDAGFNFCVLTYRVKAKTPWISHNGTTFPKCLPSDIIDTRDETGGEYYNIVAEECLWGYNDRRCNITDWRLAE